MMYKNEYNEVKDFKLCSTKLQTSPSGGRKIKSIVIDKKANSYLLNTSSLSKGFYFVTLNTDNKIIANKKLIIIK